MKRGSGQRCIVWVCFDKQHGHGIRISAAPAGAVQKPSGEVPGTERST